MRTHNSLSTWLAVVGLSLAFGCTGGGDGDGGGGSGGGGPGGADGALDGAVEGDGAVGDAAVDAAAPDPVVEALDRCGASEHYVVRSVDRTGFGCLDDIPFVGDGVRLVREPSGVRLLFAGRDLMVDAVTGDCAVGATTCRADEFERGDRTSLGAELVFEGETARLRLVPEVYDDYRLQECDTAEVVLVSVADCPLGGRYVFDAPATLVEGACDFEWPAETVRLSVREMADDFGDRGTLRWGTNDLDVRFVDPAACTVSGGRVTFYNGVSRSTQFEATLVGDRLDVVITDGLDEPDDAGNTCTDARFEASGVREAPGEADPGACEPLPFVCGDGVCDVEAGEGCGDCSADCRCSDETFCVYYRRSGEDGSASACTRGCEEMPCGDGEKCVPGGRFDVFVVNQGSLPRDRLVCLPSPDPAPLGAACGDALGCEDALLCGFGGCFPSCDDAGGIDNCRMCFGPEGAVVCRPSCDPAASSEACGEAPCLGDVVRRTCVDDICLPSTISYACLGIEVPGYGEPCLQGGYCAAGTLCGGYACEGGECADQRCTRACESDDDCEAPLPRCRVAAAADPGYCAP